MSRCVAVFDVGKTNIKLVVFDRGGGVLAERSAPNVPLAPHSEWPYLRLDTEGAWSFLIDALRELGARFYIEAISTTTHGCAGVLMDSDGPALPPLDYEFDGFAAVDANYDAARPPFDEARSPLLSRGLTLGPLRSRPSGRERFEAVLGASSDFPSSCIPAFPRLRSGLPPGAFSLFFFGCSQCGCAS